MSNWDKFCKPPSTALKQIGGGRLKGMTDINPQWRYKAMTDVYGECGDGWKYTIDKLWIEDGVAGEKAAFAQVSLHVGKEAIPGIGGSMLIAKESSGLRTSDEAFKMAVTDALSVAMKMLGVGADIYMGLWDGSKYKDAPEGEKKNGNYKPAFNVLGFNPKVSNDAPLSDADKQQVENVVEKALKWLAQNKVADAVLEIDNAGFHPDQWLYVNSFFDSTQRRLMKAEAARLKEEINKKELATQE